MGAAAGKFSCDQCDKSYTWKPELAGRRVKCKCGHALSVPKDDPAAAAADNPPDFDDFYALAEGMPVAEEAYTPPPISRGGGGSCPSCGASVDAGAVICVSCGHNLKTGKKLKTSKASGGDGGGGAVAVVGGGGSAGLLGYAAMAAPRRGGSEGGRNRGGNDFFSPVNDLYIPAALIVIGTLLTYVEVWFNKGVKSPGLAVIVVGCVTLINLALCIPAILTTVKLFDLGLGPVPTGLLKIAAAAIFPTSIAAILQATIGQGAGFFLAWIISYAITVGIFMWLLEMDYFETAICATIIWLIRTWLVYAVLYLILGSMLGKDSGGNVASGGNGAGGKVGRGLAVAAGVQTGDEATDEDKNPPPPPPPAWEKYEEEAKFRLQDPAQDPADLWVAEGQNQFYGFNHEQSIGIVRDLKALGCTQLVAVDIGVEQETLTVADAMVFTLPSDAEKREKVFEYYGKLNTQRGGDLHDVPYEGQRHFTIRFLTSFRRIELGEYHSKFRKATTASAATTRPATAPIVPAAP